LADFEALLEKFRQLAGDVLNLVSLGKKILIVTHIDADGLVSGSVAFGALARRKADVAVRTVPDLDERTIAEIATAPYDFVIFTDLASSLLRELESAMGGRYAVIDHHQIPEGDRDLPQVVNAWRYGIDGGSDACSSSMSYFFAKAVDSSNRDLSYLAVVGALADRQDSGEGRSLTGLNKMAADDAKTAGLLLESKDLLFTGRETRPVHDAVALTSTPYMEGVTGNRDAVLSALIQAGFRVRETGRWRTFSELSEDEKRSLVEVVASMITGGDGAKWLSELVGETYTFPAEDPFTSLRDAREFGTFLNACGRSGATAIGMSVCLGDRGPALAEGMKVLSDYRSNISKALQGLSAEPARLEVRGRLLLVRAEDIVSESLLGPVTSIMSSAPEHKDKVLVARTRANESDFKISSRVGDSFTGDVNLGHLMGEAAQSVGGVGGGHNMAAGAKIPARAADAFFKFVADRLAQ
jgi:single-stranded-DNA-specific exonuclease